MRTQDFLIAASICLQDMRPVLSDKQYELLELVATAMADQIDGKFKAAEAGILDASKRINAIRIKS